MWVWGLSPFHWWGGGGPGAPPNTILILATLKGVFKCILIDQAGKEFWSWEDITFQLLVHS